MVTEEDFMEAHKELVPSVSADELRHYDRVRKQFEGAGKKEDEKKTDGAPTPSNKGKGKARAIDADDEDLVIRTEHLELNGNANGNGNGHVGGSGKGKGRATSSSHAAKSSVDIAEGGFGDATQDEDLYA